MYNLTDLSKDEIKYICEHMHLPSVRLYFQKHPKEFNKIRPGFTTKKMTDGDTLSFLIKYAHKPFVQALIQSVITEWLSQIKEKRDLLEQQGYSSGEALLKIIPDSVFCDWFELYFKIAGHTIDENYLKLFSDALSLIKRTSEANDEDDNTEIKAAQIEEANKVISELKDKLEQSKKREEVLQNELNNANERLRQIQAELNESNDKLQKAEASLSEIHDELNHYHMLERYADGENAFSQFSLFQYTSIGQIKCDYNERRMIFRLADITSDGKIMPFIADENSPRYFANRDRLYWKNGPDTENAIGVWNWNAIPRDTDPEKDYLETDYCSGIQLTQIIEISKCESLDDIATFLIEGVNNSIVCGKVLFVFTEGTYLKGLLCSSNDLENCNDKVRLKASVYTLPQYTIKAIDSIEIANIRIYNNVILGIPQLIYQIRTPYEAVKTIILSRITNSAMREYELSKKEVQRCRQFFKSIPTQTIIQELSLAYNCSQKEAQEYIDGFIDHADAYLSSTDLDVNIISRAIKGNSELLELCKAQLTEDWKQENIERLVEAEEKLKDIEISFETKQKEIEKLLHDKVRLSAEVEVLHSQLSEREQLAFEVETKIASQIEKAKQNAADFISNMAFVSPIISLTNSDEGQSSKSLSVFYNQIECEAFGEIDDIDTFEEELSDNLMLIGYNEEQSIEISQAISFGIFEKYPLVISENAKPIAQCLAVAVNGGTLSEIFIPNQGVSIELLSDTIIASDENEPAVYLLHGVFDSYSINLFNALSSLMRNWKKNFILMFSLEGIPSHMLSVGVWNRAIYIDGDCGYERKDNVPLHAFNILNNLSIFDRTIDVKSKEYRELRKSLKPFTAILSNMQISLYLRYLSAYKITLNESKLILSQMIVVASSLGNIEKLNDLFHENGISNGEKMLEIYL